MNDPAAQAFENHINLEKPKQGQDTDMNVIDSDCRGSRADVSSYFCSGGHGGIFSYVFFLLNQGYRVHLSRKNNSSLAGRQEETQRGSYFLYLSHFTSPCTPKDYLVS